MIEYHYETDYELDSPMEHTKWLTACVRSKDHEVDELHFIFCSDAYLLEINKKYLQHDFLTDIITFPEEGVGLKGDLFISIDRVAENSVTYGVPADEELRRVMIHGVLHLMGMEDATADLKNQMRLAEDELLQLFHVKH